MIAGIQRHLCAHLLPVVALCFAIGIACAPACEDAGLTPIPLLFLPPLITGACALLAHLRGRKRAALFLLLPFLFGSGLVHGLLAGRPPASPQHIFNLVDREMEAVLICTLRQMPKSNRQNLTLLVDLHSLRRQQQPDFIAARGLVQCKLADPGQIELAPGDLLAIYARLRPPTSSLNPGSFDYPAFLARQGVWITGWISSPLHVTQLPREQGLTSELACLPERLRGRISTFIDQRVSPEISGVYKAILIGETSGISEEILESFRGSGAMHILAISGAHLSILAGFLFFSLYWLLRRSEQLILHFPVKKIAGLLCLPILTLYALLAGANPPVIRALIMVIVFMAALCADRKSSPFTPLALAALIILVRDPNSLFGASFQLSFLAVTSIALTAPLLTRITRGAEEDQAPGIRFRQRLFRYTLAAFTISIVVTIGAAPLLLHLFNRISIIGPVANLPLEALICFWSLPLGFLACPFIFIEPGVAAFLLQLGGYGLSLALKAAAFFNALTFSTLWLPTPAPGQIALYYGSVLLVLVAFSGAWTTTSHRFLFLRRGALIVGFTTWGTAVFLLFLPPAELFRHRITTSEITFLDVGQGSSTFLQLPSGARMLIDGGGFQSAKFNVGEDLIARFLWQKGIKRLDAVAVTHGDADHYNGIPFLLRRFHPQTLWVNDVNGHDRAWADLLALAERLGITIKIPRDGETLLTGGRAKVVSLGNPMRQEARTTNDRGLILRFEESGEETDRGQPPFSCLFAGDIGQKVEARLVDEKVALPSTFLLSPHHGSSTSNSEIFLKAVNPRVMIVSAGRHHPDHFPAPEVRKRCDALGIDMLTTAEHGAITINGGKLTCQGETSDP